MLRIIAFVLKFAKEGINVVIAADGITRMHTKRASFQHATDQEHARIIALRSKQELAVHLQSNSVDNDRIVELQKIITAKENSASSTLPDDFIDIL